MKCNDNVKDFRGYINITLNTGRCFTSCKPPNAELEESVNACRCQVRLQDLDCQQNQQAYILQIKLTQIIADAGNALCCCQVNK